MKVSIHIYGFSTGIPLPIIIIYGKNPNLNVNQPNNKESSSNLKFIHIVYLNNDNQGGNIDNQYQHKYPSLKKYSINYIIKDFTTSL